MNLLASRLMFFIVFSVIASSECAHGQELQTKGGWITVSSMDGSEGYSTPRLSRFIVNSASWLELEIVEEQKTKLRNLVLDLQKSKNSLREETSNVVKGLSTAEARIELGKLNKKIEKLENEFEAEVSDLLLPHQLAQLKAQRFTSFLNRYGFRGLGSLLVKIEGLSKTEKSEIEEFASEVEKEVSEKVRQIRMDAFEKVLGKLPPEKRKAARALVGLEK